MTDDEEVPRWVWLGLRDEAPDDALRAIQVADAEGGDAGVIVMWDRHRDRPADALRADGRITATGGTSACLSLALGPAGISLPFDDLSVMHALRGRLSTVWPGLCTSLLVDWSRIGGALTGATDPETLEDDPFARVFTHRRLLRVEPGALGAIPAPTGPGTVRYGSGNPWPWDRYEGQVS